jgi:hypothetical protein
MAVAFAVLTTTLAAVGDEPESDTVNVRARLEVEPGVVTAAGLIDTTGAVVS